MKCFINILPLLLCICSCTLNRNVNHLGSIEDPLIDAFQIHKINHYIKIEKKIKSLRKEGGVIYINPFLINTKSITYYRQNRYKNLPLPKVVYFFNEESKKIKAIHYEWDSDLGNNTLDKSDHDVCLSDFTEYYLILRNIISSKTSQIKPPFFVEEGLPLRLREQWESNDLDISLTMIYSDVDKEKGVSSRYKPTHRIRCDIFWKN